jgi:hypothetical protein
MGRIIPYIMENNKCLKPRPTSSDPQNSVSFGSIHVNLLDGNLIREGSHQKKHNNLENAGDLNQQMMMVALTTQKNGRFTGIRLGL